MDVEIAKKSGEVFRLSDYGVVQDFVVNSIDKRTHRENIDGRPGAVNYGTYDGDRTITVPFIFKARDLHDYVHLRDELYGLLDDNEPFYIREMRRLNYLQYEFVDFGEGHKWSPGTDDRYVNGKQILVRLNSVISPEQEFKNGKVNLEFVSYELPYFESIYTTLELHNSGYSATAEKYGLVDNIDDEKVKYRFTPDLVYTDFTSDLFEQGSMYLSNGENSDGNNRHGRLKNHYSVTKGQNYQLNLSETGGTINYIRIFHYDSSGNHISNEGTPNVQGNDSVSYEFTALGESVRFLVYAYETAQVNIGGIGTLTKISLSSFSSTSEFNVYNAGNVTIEPESAQLFIQLSYVTSDGNLKVTNKTTGETFEYYRSINRRHLRLDGMVMTEGTTNRFRDSNRRFISLAPGDNEFEISGGTFSEIRFIFKYLYK